MTTDVTKCKDQFGGKRASEIVHFPVKGLDKSLQINQNRQRKSWLQLANIMESRTLQATLNYMDIPRR